MFTWSGRSRVSNNCNMYIDPSCKKVIKFYFSRSFQTRKVQTVSTAEEVRQQMRFTHILVIIACKLRCNEGHQLPMR